MSRSTRHMRAALPAIILGLGAVVGSACAPPPPPPPPPAANLGCFVSILGGTSVRIYQSSNGSTFFTTHNNTTCAGTPTTGPTQIWSSPPSPTMDAICQALHGPDAYSTVSGVGQLIVPPQTFTTCNYPL